MKSRLSRYIFLLLTLSFIAATCKKNSSDSTVVRGKLVHRSCASIVVEILDSSSFSLGQADWTQNPAGPTRHNVFAVANPCQFPAMDTSTVFNFKVINDGRDDCVICMMFDNPPAVKHEIKVVEK